MAEIFRDRADGGRRLATLLQTYAHRSDVLVLGLPRGGVPVAYEVARALDAPLDVFLVRKLGVPGHEELAMGAIATGGIRILNDDVLSSLGISHAAVEAVTARERQVLEQRERVYRDGQPAPDVRGRIVILVDDGIATGSTMRAVIAALRQQHPARIVVAVPAAAASTCQAIRAEVDEIVCAITPEPFYAVGLWFQDFSPPTDEQIRDLLARAAQAHPPTGPLPEGAR